MELTTLFFLLFFALAIPVCCGLIVLGVFLRGLWNGWQRRKLHNYVYGRGASW